MTDLDSPFYRPREVNAARDGNQVPAEAHVFPARRAGKAAALAELAAAAHPPPLTADEWREVLLRHNRERQAFWWRVAHSSPLTAWKNVRGPERRHAIRMAWVYRRKARLWAASQELANFYGRSVLLARD